jgi:hypothetical protein
MKNKINSPYISILLMFTMQIILLVVFAIIFVVNGSDYENFWGGYGFNHKDTTRYVRNERIADITRKWCEDDTVPSTMADLALCTTYLQELILEKVY